ncbi:hypothetical protein [Tengunoibacter tsumagoiensis]|uniref:Uncharacterized protein n=1 Tax=Tengunoibacter tsumagoiensis TaxID=2014871 RepID=A0A402A3M0_9CHLR|nr:hypothetical protein [Tengunoibacter tsumagoiensis]GCE13635.1 hypothetical protein KTT_34940 [Tengunoibacter tsumagoiensis]
MPKDTEQQHAMQQYEQIVSTVFTCRSVVKYNLSLSEDQKKELLDEIDISLDILRTHIIPEAGSKPATSKKTAHAATSVNAAMRVPDDQIDESMQAHHTLQSLYRMYYIFLDTNQSTNINTFIERFNGIMSTITNVQYTMEQHYRGYSAHSAHEPIDEQLKMVSVFVADLYYIFMEFLRGLSDVLQHHHVQLETEKLAFFSDETQKQQAPSPKQEKKELMPLFGAYRAHQLINEQRGHMAARISDATVFIEFLKEQLEKKTSTREEVIHRLHTMKRLLYDLSIILADYEKASSTLFYT